MNKLCFYLLTLICGLAFSQDGYNFQTVLSDGNGQTINNTELRFRVSFLYDSPDSNEVAFSEEHQTSTNEFGLVNIIIGQGELPTGDLNIVDYSRTIFIKEEYDLGGGFTVKGFSKMMEVPVSSYTRNVSPEAFERGANFGVGAQSFNLSTGEILDDLVIEQALEELNSNQLVPEETEIEVVEVPSLRSKSSRRTFEVREKIIDNTKIRASTSKAQNQILDNTSNTAFGYSSLGNLTTGYNNTAMGYQSLKNLNTGYGNTGIGQFALRNVTEGVNNVAIGSQSLKSFIGQSNPFSDSRFNPQYWRGNNVAIGDLSQFRAKNGYWNTSIGMESMYHTDYTLGSYDTYENVAIGIAAMRNTIGNQNVAIGAHALGHFENRDGTVRRGSGNQNIAIGLNAMNENQSGSYNIAIGPFSLVRNNAGYRNVALGKYSLYNNNEGHKNIGIGYAALRNNTNGSENLAIGEYALYKNIEGRENIALGKWSLRNITDSYYNIALGTSSLYQLTSGYDNIGMGWAAFPELKKGSYNIGFGWESGFNLEEGNNNIFIGVFSEAKEKNQDNSIAIGNRAIVKQSNAIQLGNEDIELVETSGTISATAFRGDGSQLTNLSIDSSIISRTDDIITIGDDQVTEVNTSGVVSASGFKGVGDNILIDTGEGQFKNLKTVYEDLYTNPWVEFFKSTFSSVHQYSTISLRRYKIYISNLAVPSNQSSSFNNTVFKYGGGGIVRVNEYMYDDSFLVIRFYPSPSGIKVSFGQRTTHSNSTTDPWGLINVNNYVSRFGDYYRPVNLFLVDQDNNAYRIDVEVVTETRLDTPPNTIVGISHFAVLPTDTQWFKILAIGDQELNNIANGKFIEPETNTGINEKVINGTTIQFANSIGYPQDPTPISGSGYVLSPKIIYYQEAKSFVVNEQGVKTYFE